MLRMTKGSAAHERLTRAFRTPQMAFQPRSLGAVTLDGECVHSKHCPDILRYISCPESVRRSGGTSARLAATAAIQLGWLRG